MNKLVHQGSQFELRISLLYFHYVSLMALQPFGPDRPLSLYNGVLLAIIYITKIRHNTRNQFSNHHSRLLVFTKNLRPVLGLAMDSTLRLVGSGLKFSKEDLNMAAINFSPLYNLKWL